MEQELIEAGKLVTADPSGKFVIQFLIITVLTLSSIIGTIMVVVYKFAQKWINTMYESYQNEKQQQRQEERADREILSKQISSLENEVNTIKTRLTKDELKLEQCQKEITELKTKLTA